LALIVIADTTPLHYLILIEHADALHTLYGRVIIPESVVRELRHPSAPAPVRGWMMKPPTWLKYKNLLRLKWTLR